MTIGDDGIATRDNTGESWKAHQPPQRVWLTPRAAQERADPTYEFEGGIPYVPEASRDEVWEKAIAVIHETPRRTLRASDDESVKHDRYYLLKALEAARDREKQDG